jgi:Phospholipase_D-nuclease N-terminal
MPATETGLTINLATVTSRRCAVDWNFGTFLWSTLIFFFWFAVIWMFIGIFADIFRRDMSGWAKAGWIVLIVILPFIGILAYMIARPKTADEYGTYGTYSSRPRHAQQPEYLPADEIAKAAQLQDQGKITEAEFEQIKQHALSR